MHLSAFLVLMLALFCGWKVYKILPKLLKKLDYDEKTEKANDKFLEDADKEFVEQWDKKYKSNHKNK